MQESMAKATMEPALESTTVESKSESELDDADERGEIKSGCSDVRVAIAILHSISGLPKNVSVGYPWPPYIIWAPEIRACDTGGRHISYGRPRYEHPIRAHDTGVLYGRPSYIIWACDMGGPDTSYGRARYGRGIRAASIDHMGARDTGMRYGRPPYIVWAREIRAHDTGARYARPSYIIWARAIWAADMGGRHI